jgi:hypothetical protein
VDEQREQQPGRRDDAGAPGADRDDEAFARLRAADPAAGAVVDGADLRRRVAARAGAGDEPVDGAGSAPVTTLASRRRARWLQVAAVGVGAALVAGAGGYALGASGDRSGDAPAAAGPALAAAPLTSAEAAQAGAAATRFAPGFGGRTVFSAQGLPDDGGTARAWALDAAAVFSADTAARAAAVLGVEGEPRQEYGAWTVGPADGSGPTVSLQPDGTAGLSYSDPTRDPWLCTASAPDVPMSGGPVSEGSVAGEATLDPSIAVPALPGVPAPACDPPAGDAPTGDAALAQVRETMSALGVDPAGYELRELDQTGMPGVTTVEALQVVDGVRTGLSWSATLVGDGVQALFGTLAPLVDLGDYEVVGAATAVERLNDPRFGAGYSGVMPLARADAAGSPEPGFLAAEPGILEVEPQLPPEGEPTVPRTPAPGAALAWPVQQVGITGARLGLMLHTQPDGAAVLIPAYELTDAEGSAWSVLAVAEGALDLAG